MLKYGIRKCGFAKSKDVTTQTLTEAECAVIAPTHTACKSYLPIVSPYLHTALYGHDFSASDKPALICGECIISVSD